MDKRTSQRLNIVKRLYQSWNALPRDVSLQHLETPTLRHYPTKLGTRISM